MKNTYTEVPSRISELEFSRNQLIQTVRESRISLEKKFEEQSAILNHKQKALDATVTNFINENNSNKSDFMEKLLNGRQEANRQFEEILKKVRVLEEFINHFKMNDSGNKDLNTSSTNNSRLSRNSLPPTENNQFPKASTSSLLRGASKESRESNKNSVDKRSTKSQSGLNSLQVYCFEIYIKNKKKCFF